MSPRLTAKAAWVMCALTLLLAVLTVTLVTLGWNISTPGTDRGNTGLPLVPSVLASLAFSTVGALVASRLRDNQIGWVFLTAGVLLAVGASTIEYADYSVLAKPGSLPDGKAMFAVNAPSIIPTIGLIALTVLLFPDGRLSSRRWRWVIWLLGTAMAVGTFGYAFRAGPYDAPYQSLSNPLGIAGGRNLFDALSGLGWLLLLVGIVASAVSMILRLRGASGVERQQLKWFTFATATVGVFWGVNIVAFFAGATGGGGSRNAITFGTLAALPVGAGIAIFRYRLYEIDRVINRTLVYGALTACLGLAYLGSVLLLQLMLRPLTAKSELAIAGSTLAVAALFRPARARIQGAVDRQFFRRKYDAQRTLEAFRARVRDEVDLEALSAELRGVVWDTMQPAHVSLWLRGPSADAGFRNDFGDARAVERGTWQRD